MKLELKKKKIEGRTVWEWWVKDKREIVAGGMSDTRKNASNDAQIWMDAHAIGAMNQANVESSQAESEVRPANAELRRE